jgi:hypothetical protein
MLLSNRCVTSVCLPWLNLMADSSCAPAQIAKLTEMPNSESDAFGHVHRIWHLSPSNKYVTCAYRALWGTNLCLK